MCTYYLDYIGRISSRNIYDDWRKPWMRTLDLVLRGPVPYSWTTTGVKFR